VDLFTLFFNLLYSISLSWVGKTSFVGIGYSNRSWRKALKSWLRSLSRFFSNSKTFLDLVVFGDDVRAIKIDRHRFNVIRCSDVVSVLGGS
jgi:hypothetical protein